MNRGSETKRQVGENLNQFLFNETVNLNHKMIIFRDYPQQVFHYNRQAVELFEVIFIEIFNQKDCQTIKKPLKLCFLCV